MGDGKRLLSIGGSGLVGAIVAVLADLMQKDVASAILRMGEVLGDTLHTPSPSVVAMVVVIALAVAVCFIFECDTTTKAFYTGASILTIVMMAVPYKAPPEREYRSQQTAPAAGRGARRGVADPSGSGRSLRPTCGPAVLPRAGEDHADHGRREA